MSNDKNRRQFISQAGSAVVAGSTLALSGCMGLGGVDGEVNVEVDGIEVTSTEVREQEELGFEFIEVVAVLENTGTESVDVDAQGAFYDGNDIELNSASACNEIPAGEAINEPLLSTERVDDAERYTLTLVENQGFSCF